MKIMMTTTTLAALTVALFQTAASAASRVWTDVSGKTIEAEQVKLLNDQVLLRLTDGRDIKVSLDTLSAADRQIAMLNQPPTLELKVSAKTNRSNSNLRAAGRGSRVQIQEESTQVKVVATKTSSAPYDASLTATLCVMGVQEGGKPVLIDKVSKSFAYVGKNKEFELASGEFESRQRQDGDRRASYEGWLVVITDSNENIVATKSSKREYAEHAESLIGANAKTALTADYESEDSKKNAELARRGRF